MRLRQAIKIVEKSERTLVYHKWASLCTAGRIVRRYEKRLERKLDDLLGMLTGVDMNDCLQVAAFRFDWEIHARLHKILTQRR
jgi:hypothetical protein